jgi:pilus assembly protein Flp/PilA
MELIKRFFREEDGAEVTEYALVLGLVALAAIAGLSATGTALLTWWTTLGGYISTTLMPGGA